MRRAYAAVKKHSKKLVLKMGRRQQPGQKAPQVRHILLSGRLPRAVAAWMRISSAACKSDPLLQRSAFAIWGLERTCKPAEA